MKMLTVKLCDTLLSYILLSPLIPPPAPQTKPRNETFMQVPLPFAGYPSPQMQYFSAYELKPVSGQADPVLLA